MRAIFGSAGAARSRLTEFLTTGGAEAHRETRESWFSLCSPVPPVVRIFASAASRHIRVLRLRRTAAELNLSLGTALAHQQQANAFQQIHGLVHSLG